MASTSIRITWLGHATFRIQSARGQTLIIDPWLQNNPACPDAEKRPATVDAMLITHGHFDHIGDAVETARATRPQAVVAIYETTTWLQGKGVENCVGMNKGGTVDVAPDIRATMVQAQHSCGILDGGQIIYGGEACGYVIEFENGTRVYHAGDTNVFGDMKIIGELYQPHVALLPIGGFYTMSPREAALAARLLGTKRIIPMHYGTFPALTGTPEALRELTKDIAGLEIRALKPGESCEV
jgi:L-ascorbate metabolism protein UlaG (beta-lactamase superfamily)